MRVSSKLDQYTEDANDFSMEGLKYNFEPVGETKLDINAFMSSAPNLNQQAVVAPSQAQPISNTPIIPLPQPEVTQVEVVSNNQPHRMVASYYESHLVVGIDAPGITKEDVEISTDEGIIIVKYTRDLQMSEYDDMYGNKVNYKTNISTNEVKIPVRVEKSIESVRWAYKNGVIYLTIEYRKKIAIVVEEN